MALLPDRPSRPWSPPAGGHAPLLGEVDADVAVVGGGIAGLTTAVLLARAGARVRVLEAGMVGHGTTGASTAKVTALQALRLSELRSVHGDDVLAPYAAAQQVALRWIVDRAEERDAPSGLERRESVTYTTEPDRAEKIEAEAAAATIAGLDVILGGDDDTFPFPVARSVRLAGQAQIDPQAWVDDLAAELAEAEGCAVHEHSRVVDFADGYRSVVTDGGRVRARHVVLATLLPTTDRGLFFARAEPSMSHGVALVAEGDVPASMSYGSDARCTRSLRTATDGDRTLLLVGGEGHPVGREPDTAGAQRRLVEWARQHFPVGEVVHRWAAHDLRPADLLPYAGRTDRLPGSPWVATGFGKWGLTNGTAAALTIAGRITGAEPRVWDGIFSPGRNPKFDGARETARLNAHVAVEMTRGWAVPTMRNPPSAPPVRRCGLTPCAEVDGHRVHLACTHLGGIVRWDEAEGTWDCPLHGSRFRPGGTVVAGPAVRALKRD